MSRKLGFLCPVFLSVWYECHFTPREVKMPFGVRCKSCKSVSGSNHFTALDISYHAWHAMYHMAALSDTVFVREKF